MTWRLIGDGTLPNCLSCCCWGENLCDGPGGGITSVVVVAIARIPLFPEPTRSSCCCCCGCSCSWPCSSCSIGTGDSDNSPIGVLSFGENFLVDFIAFIVNDRLKVGAVTNFSASLTIASTVTGLLLGISVNSLWKRTTEFHSGIFPASSLCHLSKSTSALAIGTCSEFSIEYL